MSQIFEKKAEIFITGVSFNEDSMEIIYIDDAEQTSDYGFLHTIFLKTDQGELKRSFDLLQAELIHLISMAWNMKNGEKVQTLEDLIASRGSSQEALQEPSAPSVVVPDVVTSASSEEEDDDDEEAGFEFDFSKLRKNE